MSHHERLFGTDGIRDLAGEGFLTPTEIGRVCAATAATLECRERFPADFPTNRRDSRCRSIVLGRDTRDSGREISDLVAGALCGAGYDVLDVGVVPTPGVAFVASARADACLGIMISASHNPAEYNGIKFLAPTGAKISAAFEDAVTVAHEQGRQPRRGAEGRRIPTGSAIDEYIRFLVSRAHDPASLRGRTVALDLANGATFQVAPKVFRELGAEVVCLAERPDGGNINANCGALHPESLAELARSRGAHVGFAFDGDGDRMIPVTGVGDVLNGDDFLAIVARYLASRGELPTKTVVATVMSNLGLERALDASGIRLLRTAVGDRHVHRAMLDGGHSLGGEQSGHLILLDDAQTGDGILAAVRLVDSLSEYDGDISQVSRLVKRYPQILLNFRVPRKVPFGEVPGVTEAVERAERQLGDDGRIVLRYSGTEPLARVMVEGPTEALIQALAREIGAEIVRGIP